MKTFASSREAENRARNGILPYWMKLEDEQCGGWFGLVDGQGVTDKTADKGLVLHARLLWTFSAAYRRWGEESYLRAATRAFRYLEDTFWDAELGGYLWMVSRTGEVVDARKQAYGQAFCLYALSEYYAACGEQKALKKAHEVFRMLQDRFYDPQYGGYAEVLNREMTGPLRSVKMLSDDIPAAKTMNTQLHVMEAFTRYCMASGSSEAAKALRELVELFNRTITGPKGHLLMYFDEAWNSLSARESYGHDIETAWLLGEAAEALGDEELKKRTERVSLRLAQQVLLDGMGSDGGLDYECDPGQWRDDERCWWVQAECSVGMMYAYTISGEHKYLQASLGSWEYIGTHVIDHENGEWFRRVRKDGTPRTDLNKADAWKCPYHNTRACLEMAGYLSRIQ